MNYQQLYDIQSRQKRIGDEGENFVLAFERHRLAGHPGIENVRIAGRKDIGLGYDIVSYDGFSSTTIDRYIEVKTYAGNPHFYMSLGERTAAEKYGDKYFVYLVDEKRIGTPDYEPLVISDPLSIDHADNWAQRIQQTEFVFVGNNHQLPEDFDDSTVVIGCFNDNAHQHWINATHCYNVRADVDGRNINGAVPVNDMTLHARYLILYSVQAPGVYWVYRISQSRIATNADMRRFGYRNPHCLHYILYKLEKEVTMAAIDVMQILRVNNDKVTRTSGTPIYMLGERVKRYLVEKTLYPGLHAPRRGYSNTQKPWTEVQDAKLTDWISEGKSIGYIAQRLYRTPEEIATRLQQLQKR